MQRSNLTSTAIRARAAGAQDLEPVRHARSVGAGWAVALALLASDQVNGMIFYSTGNPNHNTSAPAGELADSGWQYQGRWGVFLGTPIAPRHFITAKHVGGTIGESFYFDGKAYPTVAAFDDPASDLRIWQVAGEFPRYAPLYTGRDEVGKGLVVFGRGTRRGDPIVIATGHPAEGDRGQGWFDRVKSWCGLGSARQVAEEPTTLTGTPDTDERGVSRKDLASEVGETRGLGQGTPALGEPECPRPASQTGAPAGLRGWRWGRRDGVLRWGENVVDVALDYGGRMGSVLWASFSATAGPNEAALSNGDSGGAVFVHDAAGWKLAGINLSVDGPYRLTPGGRPVPAALFDRGGLYQANGQVIADMDFEQACGFFATRISSRLDWIQGVLEGQHAEPILAGQTRADEASQSAVPVGQRPNWLSTWWRATAKLRLIACETYSLARPMALARL
ncbi:MAG: hypothetical protein FJ387_14245 [Verrucomicrobia bacterium]|nr:hypothetical protein [Verrucomicrobiota bacterium]